ERTLDELRDLITAAPPWTLPAPGDDGGEHQVEDEEDDDNPVSIISAADIEPQEVTWAWEGRVPLGMVTLLVGMEGLGKSTLALDLAARLSRGQLAGALYGRPVDVFVASTEDDRARVIVPRLRAAGADLARVHLVGLKADEKTGILTLPDHLPALRERCRQ